MKNTTEQPLKQTWTDQVDKNGKFHMANKGQLKNYFMYILLHSAEWFKKAVAIYKQKYMYEVLVHCLFKLAQVKGVLMYWCFQRCIVMRRIYFIIS